MEIKEALEDISTVKRSFHRTSFNELIEILKSGHLRGFDYMNDKEQSLSRGRKSIFSKIDSGKIKSEDLSGNIGKVEIILFDDRIKGSHLTRNVKSKPIAEVPIMNREFSLKTANRILYMKKEREVKEIIKEIITIGKSVLKEMKLDSDKGGVNKIKYSKYRPMIEKLPAIKLLATKHKIDIDSMKDLSVEVLTNAGKSKYFETTGRESEERFYKKFKPLTKNQQKNLTKKEIEKITSARNVIIPIDERLLKINLLKGFTDEVLKELESKNEYLLQQFKKAIKKNSNVFIHNDEYNKFLKI